MKPSSCLRIPYLAALGGAAPALALAAWLALPAAAVAGGGQAGADRQNLPAESQARDKNAPVGEGGPEADRQPRPRPAPDAVPAQAQDGAGQDKGRDAGTDTRGGQGKPGSTTGTTGHGGLPGSGASAGSGGTPDQR